MTYDQALETLDSYINHEKDRSFDYPEAFKLDRMRALAKEFGNPQNAYESVIIAGSKGKGSTAALLAHILRMENYRVGLYTSPHLEDVRERVQLNGLMIGETRFTEFMARMKKILDDHSWRKDPPTYFETLTVLAFLHFKEMKAHVAVLEVGLGGLYDSTNIVAAKVAGITPISLEHTDKLGKTLSKIAVQKCGVIKGREIVVSSPQVAEVDSVIADTCQERDARLVRVGTDIRIFERGYDERSQRLDVRTPWGNFYDLEISLLGTHQMENAAQAVGLAKALEEKTRLVVSDSAVKQGLVDARWPGRLEKIADHPAVVLDGAHNVDSVKKMLEALKRHFRFSRLVTVFASSSDKDAAGMIGELLPETKHLVLTSFQSPRALSARELAVRAETTGSHVIEDSRDALVKARQLAEHDDLILVTGSLYLVAELRAAFKGL